MYSTLTSTPFAVLTLSALTLSMFASPAVADDRLDIVIRGGRVIDGSGAP
jgi:hypothetical protein